MFSCMLMICQCVISLIFCSSLCPSHCFRMINLYLSLALRLRQNLQKERTVTWAGLLLVPTAAFTANSHMKIQCHISSIFSKSTCPSQSPVTILLVFTSNCSCASIWKSAENCVDYKVKNATKRLKVLKQIDKWSTKTYSDQDPDGHAKIQDSNDVQTKRTLWHSSIGTKISIQQDLDTQAFKIPTHVHSRTRYIYIHDPDTCTLENLIHLHSRSRYHVHSRSRYMYIQNVDTCTFEIPIHTSEIPTPMHSRIRCFRDSISRYGCFHDSKSRYGCFHDSISRYGCFQDSISRYGCFQDSISRYSDDNVRTLWHEIESKVTCPSSFMDQAT